ncbi:ABC transporter substrate-binding protein [Nocardia sp. AG03]|uniref:ABC transporter substrate-binding protein n=1 Tax=Nocardia sp. AG03 TaxID=3025312 RepID=UPI0024188BF3|nr:ABC transporter substrate-binding protein [Nocardia sp. AG03]
MPVSARERTRFRRTAERAGRVRSRGIAVGAALLCAVALTAGCADKTDDASAITRTTTNIAGAGVVGADRDTATACPLPSAPDPGSGATRAVTHTAGVSQVPADPQRIVVLTSSALDAACALGLWERVAGAVTLDGDRPQPMYLGYGVLEVPSVGGIGQPDPARVAELKPDLILGDIAPAAGGYEALSAIAPTVLIGQGGSWQSDFTAYAAGMNRATAAQTALRDYLTEAHDLGPALNASQSQASVLRFTADTTQVQGSETFAAQVLADVGVQRPTAQRGQSYEITADELATKAEGDIVYVMFDGEQGEDHGKQVLRSTEFEELGAATDRRVFAVDDKIWHTTGLTAARAILTDLRDSLNGYVTD